MKGRAQMVALMLLPPPMTRPVYSGTGWLLVLAVGMETSFQARTVPRLVNHSRGSSTELAVSQAPASIRRI